MTKISNRCVEKIYLSIIYFGRKRVCISSFILPQDYKNNVKTLIFQNCASFFPDALEFYFNWICVLDLLYMRDTYLFQS